MRNGLKFFLSALGSLGGNFKLEPIERRDFTKPLTGRRAARSHARPLNRQNYFTDGHGSLRNRKPKRPAGMSARQWKRFYKTVRRVEKYHARYQDVAV